MKTLQRLERAEKLIQRSRFAPAVSIIGRDSDGGFMLRFGLWSGITGKAKDIISHHQTIEAAKAKYEELLSDGSVGYDEIAALSSTATADWRPESE